jgi:FhaA, N-terminal domain
MLPMGRRCSLFASVNNLVAQIDNYVDRQLSRFLKKDWPFQPILLQQEIRRVIRDNIKGFDDGSVLIPNCIQIELSEEDYEEARRMGEILHKKLRESAVKFIEEEFPNAIGDVSGFRISLSANTEVPKGSFVINAEYTGGASEATTKWRDRS